MTRVRLPFVGLIAVFAFSVSLQAGSLFPPCVTASLAAYDSSSSPMQCSVGILNFSGFTFAESGTAALASDLQIQVTPLADTVGIGGGFSYSLFSGAFSVLNNQIANYVINYRFDIDPGPVAPGADLGMDPPFGNISINQYYCLDSNFVATTNATVSCGNGHLVTLEVDNTNPTSSWNARAAFTPPDQNYGNVMTVIHIDGTGLRNGSGFDSVSGATNVQPPTPEPMTFGLAFAGLAVIGLRRKFSSRN